MRILEHGQGREKTLLFLPCTAEPVWAFEKTVALLAQSWHVFQVVYDGRERLIPAILRQSSRRSTKSRTIFARRV